MGKREELLHTCCLVIKTFVYSELELGQDLGGVANAREHLM
jgi:hypothetical protein